MNQKPKVILTPKAKPQLILKKIPAKQYNPKSLATNTKPSKKA